MKRFAMPLFFFLFLTMLSGQQAPPETPTTDPQFSGHRGAGDTWNQDQIKKMQKQRNDERQKQLKDDTSKLLQLATELKESVDKTNANVLSVEVIRKAEEIEKLSKRIKTNMRDEVR